MALLLDFLGDLPVLLKSDLATNARAAYDLTRRASIKDIIESMGVPHPEVGCLVLHEQEIPFTYIPRDNDVVEVWPLPVPLDVTRATLLRPTPLERVGFVVDVNVGKLATLLRMAGFDTLYEKSLHDFELADLAVQKKRILLTRDSSLLKRKQVDFGHLVHHSDPGQQLVEIVELYGLAGAMRPFRRCLRCNEMLQPVAKELILSRLKPLTKKHYDTFHWCAPCDKIYWPGSHRDRMEEYLALVDEHRQKGEL